MDIESNVKLLLSDEMIDPYDIKFKDKANALVDSIKESFKSPWPPKAVLGIDIYKYSSTASHIQPFIPHIFNGLRKITFDQIFNSEQFIFQEYLSSKDKLINDFIDTGDGGYQFFDTPIHALFFGLMFQANIQAYNSYKLFPYARNLTGKIELRYALTYDSVYSTELNHYGKGIINNVRILGRDSLNRFIVDDNTAEWFSTMFNGIDNLANIYLTDFKKIPRFEKYTDSYESLFFVKEIALGVPRIKIVIASKLKDTKVKNTDLQLHNLFLQVNLDHMHKFLSKFTITIGNLNISGIE